MQRGQIVGATHSGQIFFFCTVSLEHDKMGTYFKLNPNLMSDYAISMSNAIVKWLCNTMENVPFY